MTTTNNEEAGRLGLRVLRGAGWITLASWTSRVLSLFTAPIMTALLNPAQYGVAALASTVSALGSQLALLGMDMGYARYWGGRPDRIEAERYCWRFALAGGVIAALVAVSIWQGFITIRIDAPAGLAIGVSVVVLAQSLRSMATIRSRFLSQYGRLAISNVLAAVVTAASSVAMAYWWRSDAWAIVAGVALGVLASLVLLAFPPASTFTTRSGLDRSQRREIVGLSVAGCVSGLMFWITSSSDRWFIAGFEDEAAVGLYAFASNIGTVGLAVSSSLVMTWFPEVTRLQELGESDLPALLGRQWARMVVLQLVVWLAVVTAGADIVRLLADSRFHGSIVYIPWIAAGIFFYGVASIATTGLWLAKTMRAAAFWSVGSAAINIALNGLLVPSFGALGAAVSWMVAQAGLAVGLLISSHRAYALRIPWTRLVAASLPALVLAWPLSVAWSPSPLVSLAMKLPVGLLAATAMVRIAAPSWTDELVRRLLSKVRRAT